MKLPVSRIHFFSIVLLFFVSCNNRGCSKDAEIHSETKEAKIGENTYVFEVALIESSRYRKLRKTGSSYHIAYKAQRNGQDLPLTIEHPDVEYGLDLMPYLNDLSIEVDEGDFVFRVTSGSKILRTFLNLEGIIIESPFANDGQGNLNAPDESQTLRATYELRPEITAFPLSVQPSKAMFTEKLVNGEIYNIQLSSLGKDKEKVLSMFLLKQNLSDDDLFTLFKRWPEEGYVDDIFTDERITEYKASRPLWAESVINLMVGPSGEIESEKYQGLIYNQFKDESIIHRLDQEFYDDIGSRSWLTNTEKNWIQSRVKCDVPMIPEMEKEFKKVTRKSIEYYPEGTKAHFDLEFDLDVALALSRFFGEDELVKSLLPKMMEVKTGDFNRVSNPVFSSPEVLEAFDEADRMIILNKLFSEIKLDENRVQSDMQDLVDVALEILTNSNKEIIANKWLAEMDNIDGIPLRDFVNSLAPVLGCEVMQKEILQYMKRNGTGDKFWLEIDKEFCN